MRWQARPERCLHCGESRVLDPRFADFSVRRAQIRAGVNQYPPGLGIQPDDIERRLVGAVSPADVEPAALPHGEMDDAFVPAQDAAVHMHDLARIEEQVAELYQKAELT